MARAERRDPMAEPVQLNTRIPMELKIRLVEHVDTLYQNHQEEGVPKDQEDWPFTLTGVIEVALDNYLATHVPARKRGPKPDTTPKEPLKLVRKSPEEGQ